MKLYEFEGKSLLKKVGIPVPEGEVVNDVHSAQNVIKKIGFPVVVKIQVLRGGRGKAGGIRIASNEAELNKAIYDLTGQDIKGERVNRFLIEKQISTNQEFYAGITLDHKTALPLLLVSSHGGVDIEDLAQKSPEFLIRMTLDPLNLPRRYHMINIALKVGLTGKVMMQLAEILMKLVEAYFTYEALTAEINPLIQDKAGGLYAGDAKVEIDDSALFRVDAVRNLHREGTQTSDTLEREAQEAGLAYVRIANGNIGLIAGGAGLCMASMDMISTHGGESANFLDLGGGASAGKTADALRFILKTPGVKGVFMNLFGGINNCEEMAKGIVSVFSEQHPTQPIVVKMRGHSQEEGWKILEALNIPVVKYGTTEEAVKLLLSEMNGEKRGDINQ